MVNNQIGGKVFLLGEYSVVGGGPALVAITRPEFKLKSVVGLPKDDPQGTAKQFSPQSPVGRLKSWAESRLAFTSKTLVQLGLDFSQLDWIDPVKSAPHLREAGVALAGLGSSTAEFAAYYLALAQGAPELKLGKSAQDSWKAAYILYRELHNIESVVPSGADLVAQLVGGLIQFTPSRFWRGDMDGSLQKIKVKEGMKGFPVILFTVERQFGRKVATHHHLVALKAQGFFESPLIKNLREWTERGAEAILNENWEELGHTFTQFAELLFQAGLELETTTEDRQFFSQFPEVLGSKGMGALQADGVLVVLKPDVSEEQIIAIIRAADIRKLTCHSRLGQLSPGTSSNANCAFEGGV